MAQRIRLHGGPWHGRTVEIPDNRDHFHIIEPVEEIARYFINAPTESEAFETAQTREGTYSRVQGYPGNYEWDGWRSHD